MPENNDSRAGPNNTGYIAIVNDSSEDTPPAGRPPKRFDLDKIAISTFVLACVVLEVQFFAEGGLNLGNLILTAATMAVMFLGGVSGSKGNRLIPRFTWSDFFFLAYIAWCFASYSWSYSRLNTLVQSSFILMLWLGSYFSRYSYIKDGVRNVVRFSVIIAILSFAMIVVAPGRAFQPHSSTGFPELRGIINHQLHLGALMSVAVGFLVISFFNREYAEVTSGRRYRGLLIFLILLVCGIASLARSYILYAVISLMITALLGSNRALRWLGLSLIIAITIFIVQNYDAVVMWMGDESGDATFSGRTRVWRISYQAYLSAPPWLGFGFASFNLPRFDYLWNLYRPPHPHNTIISALFETGIVGAWLISIYMIVSIIQLVVYSARNRTMSYGLFMMIMSFFSGLTGVVFAGKLTTMLALTVLISGLEISQRWRS